MFSQKLFRFAHKIALIAIMFASFAPSIAHALAAKNSTSFAQEICTTNGQKITIQVLTTQGQQLTTELALSKSEAPKNISMHLEHCPFCASHAVGAAVHNNPLSIIALLETTAQKAEKNATPIVASRHYKHPPSQAPPHLSIV